MLMALVFSTAALAQSATELGNWHVSPFLRPQGSLSSWNDGNGSRTALQVGAQAGVNFREKADDLPRIRGQARVMGNALVNAASGVDVRAGVFAGPSWQQVRLQTGPDVYWNQYDWGNVVLPSTLGLAWPVQALTQWNGLSLSAGIQPSFFLRSERESVDWSEQTLPGFGDEMTVFATVATALGGLRLNVSASQTTTAYGTQRGLGFGFRI